MKNKKYVIDVPVGVGTYLDGEKIDNQTLIMMMMLPLLFHYRITLEDVAQNLGCTKFELVSRYADMDIPCFRMLAQEKDYNSYIMAVTRQIELIN